jgi:hypothetical protein
MPTIDFDRFVAVTASQLDALPVEVAPIVRSAAETVGALVSPGRLDEEKAVALLAEVRIYWSMRTPTLAPKSPAPEYRVLERIIANLADGHGLVPSVEALEILEAYGDQRREHGLDAAAWDADASRGR